MAGPVLAMALGGFYAIIITLFYYCLEKVIIMWCVSHKEHHAVPQFFKNNPSAAVWTGNNAAVPCLLFLAT